MVLSNYQGSYNGLTFGAGSNIQFAQIDGLRDMTQIVSGDVPIPRMDGAFPGVNTLGERILVLTFAVFSPVVAFETILEQLTAAFQPISNPSAQQVLQFMLPGWASPRQVTGRPTKGAIPIDLDFQFNVEEAIAIEFTCSDPLVYDSVLQSASAGLPSPTAGLTFNATPNFVFGASTGGSFQLTNSGTYNAPFVVTITGPCTNPLLKIGSLYLGFTVTLGATDTLVIDTAAQTATLNGTADRTGTILTGSIWLTLAPGINTVGLQSSDSAAVAAVFTGTFRNTWGFM
jgi:hypothetical protein